MKNQKQQTKVRVIQTVCLSLAVLAGFFTALASAKEQSAAAKPAAMVDFDATVIAVRQVPAGKPLPGIHLDAKVNNRMTDIYLAPAGFLADCGASFSKGDEVHIAGSSSKSGDLDLVLAREIRSGMTTFYLRSEDGEPLWPSGSAD